MNVFPRRRSHTRGFKHENDSIKISLPNHIQHGLEELGLVDCNTSITQDSRSSISIIDWLLACSTILRSSLDPTLALPYPAWPGTSDLKLTLKIKEPNQLLQIFSDASWGNNPQDCTSQSGYLCFLFGTLISWNSSKQRLVTYSSTEAELNPLVDSFHEGIWLKALLAEIWNIQIDSPV
ncbi:hypothetical protein VP01_337g9 [Puccinia sorghi]|uniref:Reverse transcriptase Ty1/copia-type domain-containing protein n=1 Tax=Puccinia sorghi TaxID=27349 RepID=A0A0L6UXN8_9BASI|nr:hypothetical protein VP01_337g9 [Puccinia sorghi]